MRGSQTGPQIGWALSVGGKQWGGSYRQSERARLCSGKGQFWNWRFLLLRMERAKLVSVDVPAALRIRGAISGASQAVCDDKEGRGVCYQLAGRVLCPARLEITGREGEALKSG